MKDWAARSVCQAKKRFESLEGQWTIRQRRDATEILKKVLLRQSGQLDDILILLLFKERRPESEDVLVGEDFLVFVVFQDNLAIASVLLRHFFVDKLKSMRKDVAELHNDVRLAIVFLISIMIGNVNWTIEKFERS